MRSAAAAAEGLAAALGELAGSLQPREDGPPDGGPAGTGPADGQVRPPRAAARVPAGTPGRRRPVRPGRGLSADSAAGLRELLGMAGTLVLVDGYNVSMQGWPGQPVAHQRRYLLDLLGALRARCVADIQVVFDGATDGRRPAVRAPLPVRVHFTEAGVEADDRILEFVEGAPSQAGVVVVSSDHRVRDGARSRGATPVSSSTLLELGRSR